MHKERIGIFCVFFFLRFLEKEPVLKIRTNIKKWGKKEQNEDFFVIKCLVSPFNGLNY